VARIEGPGTGQLDTRRAIPAACVTTRLLNQRTQIAELRSSSVFCKPRHDIYPGEPRCGQDADDSKHKDFAINPWPLSTSTVLPILWALCHIMGVPRIA
jgi:hypothetical protein